MDIVEDFAKIDAYLFKYKPQAQEELPGQTDDKNHVGVMAQELAQTETTKDTVDVNPETGYMELDIPSLVMTLTATCAELSKRVLALEEKLGGK